MAKVESMEVADELHKFVDLAASKVGGGIVFATDDFFAEADNLINSKEPELKEGVYTEFGKWMDGWETRRKRIPGHDWCIIKLGIPGVIRGFQVDTAFFIGNYAPRFSIQGAYLNPEDEMKIPPRKSAKGASAFPEQFGALTKLQSEKWTELIPHSPLRPGVPETRYHHFTCEQQNVVITHIRVNIYPDGGFARLRVYGEPRFDWGAVPSTERVDLASVSKGGKVIAVSDAHYGHPSNLICPGRALGMADAWETSRRVDRPAILYLDENGFLNHVGSEWAVFKLGHPGNIQAVEIDTHHFKGNSPDYCKVEACFAPEGTENELVQKMDGEPWITILPPQKLLPNKPHYFGGTQLQNHGTVNLVRLSIVPDGGVSRFRVWGHVRKTVTMPVKAFV